jgi:hypothetical protein
MPDQIRDYADPVLPMPPAPPVPVGSVVAPAPNDFNALTRGSFLDFFRDFLVIGSSLRPAYMPSEKGRHSLGSRRIGGF